LRKWQSPPDPSTNHNIAGDRQHEGTAEWFFDSDQFENWKVTGSLLWIHGKPGSGKSVLCSAIINDITTMCEAGSGSMAYFYFDFRDVDKQARRNLLPSLLIQLSTRSDAFCDVFSRLYETHDKGARQPSDKALTRCLKEMLTLPNQGPVYLVIDALDECPDASDVPSPREQVLDLVTDLVGLQLPSLRICVTSRPEADICEALESLVSQTVSLQDEGGQKNDIGSYVRSVVYSGSGKFMRRWRNEDKEHVIKTLSARADGMFRWVFCQLEVLRNCLPQNVQRVLRELPNSLDETYERMLREIGKVNPDQAYRLLQCLTVATRPLRVDELAEVLALDFDRTEGGIPVLNSAWRWDDEQQGVLSTCSSLVVVVYNSYQKTHFVQFAHFSVKEFLTSDRLAKLAADISRFHIRLEPAHTVIAQACLAILLRSNCNDMAESGSPLSHYAAQHWVDHAQFESVSLHVEDGMRSLFDPAKPYFPAWLKSYAPLCLYYAALCGFRDLTKHLIVEYPEHVNATVGLNRSPMAAALRNKHFQVAELLHQHDAVLHISHRSHTLLHAASKDGLIDVAQWLLSSGANANAQRDDCMTPLHLAAANGHLEVVRTLLGHGVDVNVATTRSDLTPLHEASKNGRVHIVRLLIENGADVDARDQSHKTPLHLASSSRPSSNDVIQTLILNGADVNARDQSHKTPLHLASSSLSRPWLLSNDIVQTLILNGADVNARDQGHSTPLHLASSLRSSSSNDVVQTLILNGADVNARDQSHKTPLHLASSSSSNDVVQTLILNGADVNAHDQSHKTPLHLASSWFSPPVSSAPLSLPLSSSNDVVPTLILNGADVNARDQSHKTPLHLASSSSSSSSNDVVQTLILNGADVNARDQSHQTPLHLASSNNVVQTLILNGADVNARDQSHKTPLHLASWSPSSNDVVQTLILKGADVNARDQSHSTSLHLASLSLSWFSNDVVQILILNGAGVNARDQSHSTPLHLASSSSSSNDVVQTLILNGADVNARDQSHSTPLHLASSSSERRSKDVVQILILNGADVNARNQSHKTPLHLASSSSERWSKDVVQTLILNGAVVNARDQSHNTPLHLASFLSSFSSNGVVQTLILNGADVNARDKSHKTPLHLASLSSLRRSNDIVQTLILNGADVNARDQSHKTPLHLLFDPQSRWSGPDTNPLSLLLENGADIDAVDDKAQTPFQLAFSGGYHEMVQLLLEHRASV
ncbi:ankyrin repeat-containing domain protein, partial [Lactarius deliciosus]